MRFEAFYDKERFSNLDAPLEAGHFDYKGKEILKKTASFYGDDIDFYIDSSDGVNEDLNIDESDWRVREIIKTRKNRPFVIFKTSYSDVHTKPMKELAQQHGGDVVPYFLWSYYGEFNTLLDEKAYQMNIQDITKKEFDIGFCSSLDPYYYMGKKELEISTRSDLHDKLQNSKFNFLHTSNVSYDEYLKTSMRCKVTLNVPGMGEYSSRMLESSFLGQAVVIRKNTYDNAISYRNHFVEIDFEAKNWEDKLQRVIDDYEFWGIRASDYWQMVYKNPLYTFEYALSVVKQRV